MGMEIPDNIFKEALVEALYKKISFYHQIDFGN
jgi:hypothetical protein